MIKKILDAGKKLRDNASAVKWKTRSAKEKATFTLCGGILAFFVCIFLICTVPLFIVSVVIIFLIALVLFMFWKILEDIFE